MSINYSDSQLTGKSSINLDLKSVALGTALDTILKGTGFTYQIQGKYIVIVEIKQPASQAIKEIKGKIVDETGEPLIGVNVSVEGGSTGTISDFDGNFSVKAPENSVLKISYIGYMTQQIPVSGKSFYQIVMKQDTESWKKSW